MSRLSWSFLVAMLVAIGVVAVIWLVGPSTAPNPVRRGLSPLQLLELSDDAGFAPVPRSWSLQFPQDHGQHDQFRTEWWHLEGVLADDDHRLLGVQFALLRLALTWRPKLRRSRWATGAIYAGLVSVTDPYSDGTHGYRRLSRDALGLAGTSTQPVRIWIEDWRLEQRHATADAPNWKLGVAAANLELDLKNRQPLIDAEALRRLGFAETGPFHFYLQPRMAAEGSLWIDGRRVRLTGMMSLEHAWGELPLPGSPVARDRFTLYLDDGRILLCVRTHRADGSGVPSTIGLIVQRDQAPQVLSNTEIELRPSDYWVSLETGARYPISWVIRVQRAGIALQLVPYGEDQEFVGWTSFWAGPVSLRAASGVFSGTGYVQLTGYEGS